MSLGIFSPYGRVSGETGFLLVLGRYLARRGYGLVQLRCNGVVARCGRDQLTPGGRQLMSCVECMVEQDRGAYWSGLPAIDLSPAFLPEDTLAHQDELSRCSLKELEHFTTEGIAVTDMCATMLQEVAGGSMPDAAQQREIRNVLLHSARTLNAFSRFTHDHQFDALLSPAGDDIYLNSLAAVAERRGIRHFRFKWDTASLSMRISGALSGEQFRSTLFFEDISAMRSNVDSWPDEIQNQLKAIESYLGITQQQLSLPII